MRRMSSDWYRKIWTLDIQDQSWVEDTERQVDFLVKTLKLRGGERILDLACGFGRHSLALARRGFGVTGVDITAEYVGYANETARKEGLNARFICRDIREVSYENAFDVVMNMADGAVGYRKMMRKKPMNFCRIVSEMDEVERKTLRKSGLVRRKLMKF